MAYGIYNPNGLKTQETTLGMPQSGYVVITVNDGGEGWDFSNDFGASNSLYAKAINAVSMYSDIYATYTPDTLQFLVQVRGDSLPLTVSQALGDGTAITKISQIASEMLGFGVTAWNARVADDSVTWNF